VTPSIFYQVQEEMDHLRVSFLISSHITNKCVFFFFAKMTDVLKAATSALLLPSVSPPPLPPPRIPPQGSERKKKTTITKKKSSKKNVKSSPVSTTSSSPESTESAVESFYNPTNCLLTRQFIESTLSKLCGYVIRIGSLERYQLAFVHKSVYRKDISPPQHVVEEFLRVANLTEVPSPPPRPVGTFRRGTSPSKSRELVFCDTYEAMEFVGDGWIGAVTGQYVCDRFPCQSEGFYTKMKQHIVCKDGLAKLSCSLGFGEWAILSSQAEEVMTRTNLSLLEDIFEAFCAAVVQDLGVGVLRIVVKNLVEATVDFREAIINDTNYKDVLKRVCQENGWRHPAYVELGDNGMTGARREYESAIEVIPEAVALGVKPRIVFLLTTNTSTEAWATGTGVTKKKAQQAAAFNALRSLEVALKYSS
jgi:dsRNA-specific ribonuclease